jgi:hypothetical protein
MAVLEITILQFADVLKANLYETLVSVFVEGLKRKCLMLDELNPSQEVAAAYENLVRRFGDTKELRLQRIVATVLLKQATIYKDIHQHAKAVCLCNDIMQRFANRTDDAEIDALVRKAGELIQVVSG